MKKIICLLFGLYLLCSVTLANDASMDFERFGGTVYPIDNDKIRMESEVINVYVNNYYDEEKDEWIEPYVECNFVFENTADTEETVLMGFPGDEGGMESGFWGHAIDDFTTTINGKKVEVIEREEIIAVYDSDGNEVLDKEKIEELEKTGNYHKVDTKTGKSYRKETKTWFTWEVTFKPKEKLKIFNTYTPQWSSPSDGVYGLGFGYIITTGKGWKGTIGETTVNFFIGDSLKNVYDQWKCNCPQYITLEGNKLVYHRTDYEPEEDIEFRLWRFGLNQIELFKGKTICINPGHQKTGNSELELMSPISDALKSKVTSGAKGEEEYNLKIAKVLKKVLEEMGAKVIMTRETSAVNISNKERAIIGNEADLVLNIHCNSADNANAKGTWLLIPSQKNLGNKTIYESSKRLAEKIKVSLSDYRNIKVFERDDLTGLNWSEVPSIFIECGFLTNEEDKKFLEEISIEKDDYEYDENLFYYQICEGISNYFYGVENFIKNDRIAENRDEIIETEVSGDNEYVKEEREQKTEANMFKKVFIILIGFGIIIAGTLVLIILKKENRKK